MDAYWVLERLTLAALSKPAGCPLSPQRYRASLAQANAARCLFDVWRDGQLHGDATLTGRNGLLMFVTHPELRNRATLRALFGPLIRHLERSDGRALSSHVVRANALSLAFSRKRWVQVVRQSTGGI
ncbi:hypothetical protein [Ferrimonas pelagia]|uniref:Uncharacterized protein n=1 Tax=Ferrimonas pelagia TaxID=1177826 RepID=A0ABP9EE86_9GAMM